MGQLPNEAVLTWAADVAGTNVAAVEPLNDRGPWRLRIGQERGLGDLVLRVPVHNWIGADMIATGAAALRLAEKHGLAAPRLVAADLDGHHAGVTATLETVLPGTSAPPPKVSEKRLHEAGAAIAKVHAIPLAPRRDLPLRIRHTQVDDHALDRRWATVYHASSDSDKPAVIEAFCEFAGCSPTGAREVLSGPPLTPLLHLADERIRALARPEGPSVFLHGDIWSGNMLWDGDTCVALIDWKTAGAGNPGVDLGNLRLGMAMQYGSDAATYVREGWERQSGTRATNVPYWDVVAALNTPAEDDGFPAFEADGSPLASPTVTKRRDAFLRAALDELQG